MIEQAETSLEVVIALHQRPEGARLTDLVSAVGLRARPVETILRRLIQVGLVDRERTRHPRYHLVRDHPATPELIGLALRVPAPARSLTVAVRASPAVWYAPADDDEFMVVHHDNSQPSALASLEEAFQVVSARDRAMPRVVRFSREEFLRLLRVAIAFRVRALALKPVKGNVLRPDLDLEALR
jgi:hypothetical protein